MKRVIGSMLAVALAACGGAPRIVGTVVDEDGQPVAKAEVRTEPASDLELSDDKGRFYIERVLGEGEPQPLPAGAYKLIVSKLPGFEVTEQMLDVSGETTVRVELKAKEADIGPAVSPNPVKEKPIDPSDPNPPKDGQ